MKDKITYKKSYYKKPSGEVETIKNAVILNLLLTKGSNVSGKIKYIEDTKTFLQTPQKDLISGMIIFCNILDASYYSMLSALSAAAVIAYSMDYNHYRQLVVVNSSVGIYGGFGAIEFEDDLKKYLTSIDGSVAYIDTLYNRVIIPSDTMPSNLKNYEFDLNRVLGYK